MLYAISLSVGASYTGNLGATRIVIVMLAESAFRGVFPLGGGLPTMANTIPLAVVNSAPWPFSETLAFSCNI